MAIAVSDSRSQARPGVVHGHERSRAWRDPSLHVRHVHVERGGMNLAGDRSRAGCRNRLKARHVGERRHHDLVAGSDTERIEGEVKRRSAGVDRHDMGGSEVLPEGSLELHDRRAVPEITRREYLPHRCELGLVEAALRDFDHSKLRPALQYAPAAREPSAGFGRWKLAAQGSFLARPSRWVVRASKAFSRKRRIAAPSRSGRSIGR